MTHLVQTLKILNVENMYDDSQHMSTSYILLYYIKARKKVYNRVHTGTFSYIHIGCSHGFFL